MHMLCSTKIGGEENILQLIWPKGSEKKILIDYWVGLASYLKVTEFCVGKKLHFYNKIFRYQRTASKSEENFYFEIFWVV